MAEGSSKVCYTAFLVAWSIVGAEVTLSAMNYGNLNLLNKELIQFKPLCCQSAALEAYVAFLNGTLYFL